MAGTCTRSRIAKARPGAPRLQILPEAPLAFFWKAMDAQIRFTTDASGMVTGAVLTQQGRQMVGRRVER